MEITMKKIKKAEPAMVGKFVNALGEKK